MTTASLARVKMLFAINFEPLATTFRPRSCTRWKTTITLQQTKKEIMFNHWQQHQKLYYYEEIIT